MDSDAPPSSFAALQRVPTEVPGLDAVLGGGLLAGDTYLIVGQPGTGKTTLGNQLAFTAAAHGGHVLVATLLTESHDRMLAHLHGFRFVDRTLVGDRIHYVSLVTALQDGGLDGALDALITTIRNHHATLLIVDGAGAAELFAATALDYPRFIHALQARTAMLGCTTVLLAREREADTAGTHVDGILQLSNQPMPARDVRWLRVTKLRGSAYLNGRHDFTIGEDGIAVFPRLEVAHAALEPAWHDPDDRLTLGIPGLDAMLVGGVPKGSSTLIFGTPGVGKTMLGLHFLAEGARRGEPGLIATFHETAPALAATADGAGLGLGPHLQSGLVRVMWRPPMELSPDEWGWQLLATVDEHRPRRLVIDAFSDLPGTFAVPERQTPFATALTNALRDRNVTALFLLEIDQYVGPELAVSVPNVSATMDTGILLRSVELRSSLRRLVSILKERQTGFDPTIRELTIGPQGMTVGDPFDATALLTGTAIPSAKAP